MTRPKVPTMPEAELLAGVLTLAAYLGWQSLHLRPARTVAGWRTPVQGTLGAGWPDLILCRGPRMIAAELKRQDGRPTTDQAYVLAVLEAAGAEVHVWRPSDLDSIAEVLR